MKSLKRTIFKNAGWLSASAIVARVFTVVLAVFMARILGAEDYGLIGFAISFAGIFVIITNFANDRIIIREYNQNEKIKEELGAILWLKIFLGIITFLIILGTSFFVNSAVRPIIIVFASIALINSASHFFRTIFQAKQKMEYVALANMGEALFLTLGGLFVLFTTPNIVFISYAYLASSLLIFIFIIAVAKHLSILIRPVFKISIIKKYFSYSWPLALSSVFAIIYIQIDSVMMGFWGMMKEVGWYQAAYRITNFVILPGTIIRTVFYPGVAKSYKENKESFQKAINAFFEIMVFLAFPIVVGGFFLSNSIILFLYGNDFLPSILAFQILIFCSGIILLIMFINSILNTSGHQKMIFYTAALAGLLNIILNIILIPRYSLYGAAVATLSSYLFLLASRFLMLKRINILPNLRVVLSALLAVLIMALVFQSGLISHLHVITQIFLAGFIYFLSFLFIRNISFKKKNKNQLNILITGSVLTGNKGATAMFLGTRKILKECLNADLRFSMLTPHYLEDLKYAQEYDVKLYKYESLIKKTIPLAMLSRLISVDNEVIKAYSEADLIIDISGITFCDTGSSYSSVINPSSYILLAMILRKPFIKFTQSYGPIKRRLTKIMARFLLNRCRLVIPRDNKSKEWLAGVGIKNLNVCVDSAFNMQSVPVQLPQRNKMLFGVCPSQLFERDNKNYAPIITELINFINESLDADVILIPHYSKPGKDSNYAESFNDDFAVVKKIINSVKYRERVLFIDKEFSPPELKSMISQCDFFIGSRYHSLVASISMKVPSIAIGWNHKYDGLFTKAGIKEYGFDFKGLDIEILKQKIVKLVANREKIKETLEQNYQSMVESSYRAGYLVKEVL